MVWQTIGSEYESPESPKDINQYNFNQIITKELDRGIQLEASLTLSNHSNEHYRPDIIDSKFLQALNGVTIQENQVGRFLGISLILKITPTN